LGAVSPHFCPDKREIWQGEQTYGSLSRAKFHVYRDNVSPLWAKKTILGPLSKNNTGMAALRAGLPVIKYGENDFKYGGWNFLHPAMWHDHEIDFVR